MNNTTKLPAAPHAPTSVSKTGKTSASRLRPLAATWLLCVAACATTAPKDAALQRQTEQARTQAKLEDRLRRLEGRLQQVDAQMAVLREQRHEAPAQVAFEPRPQEPRLLRLDESIYDGDTRELTWPAGQRIVTDAAGKVRLVAITAEEAKGQQAGQAFVHLGEPGARAPRRAQSKAVRHRRAARRVAP